MTFTNVFSRSIIITRQEGVCTCGQCTIFAEFSNGIGLSLFVSDSLSLVDKAFELQRECVCEVRMYPEFRRNNSIITLQERLYG